jgi:hypothetical protein
MNDERTRWSLFHTGHYVVCSDCPTPNGLEVRVSYNNLPIAVQRYATAADADAWTEQVRAQWEGVARRPAQVVRPVAVAAAVQSERPRPFARAVRKTNTLLHAPATASWFGFEYAWRAFC